MTNIGNNPNRRLYHTWAKGIVSKEAKRKSEIEYHPYTKIGFVFTNDKGEPIKCSS